MKSVRLAGLETGWRLGIRRAFALQARSTRAVPGTVSLRCVGACPSTPQPDAMRIAQ
jgi:hypothetical protein